uniref:hypothetical protein n=1 Tax=Orrella sp. TaxID=1921583 RepID=UPI0040478D22
MNNHHDSSPLTKDADFTLAQLADVYLACYRGRDVNFGQRLSFFIDRFGAKPARVIDGDDVAEALDALDALERRGSLHNHHIKAGVSKPLAPATINRYRCCLQAVLTWARKQRLMPNGWTNPVNEVERQAEDNARTRYLLLV